MKIYNVKNYKKFPKEVLKAFGNFDCGFEIAKNLEKIGYEVIDQDLSGGFEIFKKVLSKERKAEIIQDAIDIINFHIGSSHSDTDETEKEVIKDLEEFLTFL